MWHKVVILAFGKLRKRRDLCNSYSVGYGVKSCLKQNNNKINKREKSNRRVVVTALSQEASTVSS